jgi:hypothetical protein
VKIDAGMEREQNGSISCLLFSWKSSARSYNTIYYANSKRQNENLQHTLPPFIFLAQMVIKYPTDYTTKN